MVELADWLELSKPRRLRVFLPDGDPSGLTVAVRSFGRSGLWHLSQRVSMKRIIARCGLGLCLGLFMATAAPTALASQVVTHDYLPGSVSLYVGDGKALMTYKESAGPQQHVLAWGALNAVAPTRGGTQAAFQIDYNSGSQSGSVATCSPYTGPPLVDLVAACDGMGTDGKPDGTYWALQAWQKFLPYFGAASGPAPEGAGFDLHLSHWSGPLPVLTLFSSWAWKKWNRLYGTFTYLGQPVFGFRATSGLPTDKFGRNVYLDTFNSTYGSGWKREMGILVHNPTGMFCYSFNPHGSHPAGTGKKYQATVMGPGVTPDVSAEVAAPGPFDQAAVDAANAQITSAHDKLCHAN